MSADTLNALGAAVALLLAAWLAVRAIERGRR